MDINRYAFNLKELVLLFAVLQAIFLVFVLIRVPTDNKIPNKLLSVLLICLALILVEYVWLFAGAYQFIPRLSGFSLPGLIILSPIYYCYSKTLLQVKLDKRLTIHLLPSIAILITVAPWFFVANDTKIRLIEVTLSTGLPSFSSHAMLVLTAIGVHMLAYFFATYRLVERYEEKVKEESADVGVLSIHWLTQLSFGFCLFAVLFYITALDYLIMQSEKHILPTVLVFGIAAFVFLLAYLTYRQPDLFAWYQPGVLPTVNELEDKPKYQNTMLDTELLKRYRQQLLSAMEEEKPYLNGELRLGQLADSLSMPSHHLSQVINVAFEVSFFDFINQYRVSYAKLLLSRGDKTSNVLDIALQSGFNSKASFNRVFKREVGMTPSEFLSTQKNNNNFRSS